MKEAYTELERIFKKVQVLRSVASLLRWDAEVVMPKKSHLLRAEQLSALHALTQELVVSPQVARYLKTASMQIERFDPWQRVNIELMQRQYHHLATLPTRLVQKIDNGIRVAEAAWFEARENQDYALFAPSFQKLIGLVQEKANRLSDKFNVSPYEALMDEHDPKRKQSDVDRLLGEVKILFPKLISRAQEKNRPLIAITGRYPKRQQEPLCKQLLRLMHFPMDNGRLDESVHPFTEGVAQDIRITTIFDRQNPLNTVMGLMHELGHALYDSALPIERRFELVGMDAGMVIHEGVALFWEKILGGSPAFAKWLSGYLYEHFPHPAFAPENIYGHLTDVNPSRIRIEADEVCYLGHIILRYEIEKALFNQEIKAQDIPALWEAKVQSILGYCPSDPGMDCLQDIHWAHGYFGYFHTYGLGFLFATQLQQYIMQHHSHIFKSLEEGKFMPLLNWFKENIFMTGARFNGDEIILRSTESNLQSQGYIAYLRTKYEISD